MPRLFLHVGYPKTGTTTIQHSLALNSTKLKESGVLYPNAGRFSLEGSGRLSDAHYALTFALGIGHYDRETSADTPNQIKEKLDEEVRESGCKDIIISSEYFITCKNVQVVKDFFSDYDVRVCLYLRRHDHAYESSYNQALRSARPAPWNASIEAFILYQLGITDVPYDYLGTIRRWEAMFGRTNIIVRPFERFSGGGELLGQFFRDLNLQTPEGLKQPPGGLNESVSHLVLCAIREVQTTSIAQEKKNKIIARLISAGRGEKVRYLSSPMRNAIFVWQRAAYATIARDYLSRTNGVLFQERPPTADEPWSAPRNPTKEELIDQILQAAAPLII